MRPDDLERLRESGISPSAQRMAVAEYVLHTTDHPSADEVWNRVREHFPMISRATVYNTLNIFVEKRLLRQYVLGGGRSVFDANVGEHHHFIDEDSGTILDVPWKALRVSGVDRLEGLRVSEFQVVLRGRRKRVAPGR